jgi:hypothetical protein
MDLFSEGKWMHSVGNLHHGTVETRGPEMCETAMKM